jgi:hypothetical protein
MLKIEQNKAAKTAIDLTIENIKTAEQWIKPEQAIDFMEKIYDFLVSGGEKE